jgi:hypothetical protein
MPPLIHGLASLLEFVRREVEGWGQEYVEDQSRIRERCLSWGRENREVSKMDTGDVPL